MGGSGFLNFNLSHLFVFRQDLLYFCLSKSDYKELLIILIHFQYFWFIYLIKIQRCLLMRIGNFIKKESLLNLWQTLN